MVTGKLNVAIVGGGMTGLVFAIALRKLAPDVEFTIYEGASKLTEIGAGITIQQRAWHIMQAIGLEDTLMKIAGSDDHGTSCFEYRKSDQNEGVPLITLPVHDDSFTFHRAELQRALLEHFGEALVRTGKRLVSYTQPDDGINPIELRFQDGSTATCDVLVGADGVRSAVRESLYSQLADAAAAAGKDEEAVELRSHILPVFSGFVAYRTLIRKEDLSTEDAKKPALNKTNVQLYCGKGKHLAVYPIASGHLEGTIYQGPWTAAADREEWLGDYAHWEPDVKEVLKHVDGAMKWAINVVTVLPTYVDRRVVLLGDAAHAMTPHIGAGAGQGFEDAFFLAQMLSRQDVIKENVSIVLQVYDAVRRPFSQTVALNSQINGKTLHLNTHYAAMSAEESATGRAHSLEQLEHVKVVIQETARWHTATSITEDKEVIFKRLDEELQKATK